MSMLYYGETIKSIKKCICLANEHLLCEENSLSKFVSALQHKLNRFAMSSKQDNKQRRKEGIYYD